MHGGEPTWARYHTVGISDATQSDEPASEHYAAADALIAEVQGASAPALV